MEHVDLVTSSKPKLEGADNYKSWISRVHLMLLQHDYWRIVNKDFPEPIKPKMDLTEFSDEDKLHEYEEFSEQWKEQNNAALNMIASTCDPKIMAELTEETNASAVWDQLAELYDTPVGINISWAAFIDFSIKNRRRPAKACESFSQVLHEAREAGHEISDRTAVTHFLLVLKRAGYEQFAHFHKCRIDSQSPEDWPTLDYLTSNFVNAVAYGLLT